MASNFNEDWRKEGVLGQYLDDLYTANRIEFERTDNGPHQEKGIDLLFKMKFYTVSDGRKVEVPPSTHFRVDEKAQLSYLNKALPTFALEIMSGHERDVEGWLFDANKRTDTYSFVFSIMLKDGKQTLENKEDIQSLEVILVSRMRLIMELGKMNITRQYCVDHAAALRSSDGPERIDIQGTDFYLLVSRQLHERPVNLIVRKDFLRRIGKVLDPIG